MDFLNNVDLLFVGIAISAIGVLGFAIFFSNKASLVNRTFLLFSIVAILWNFTNYFNLNLTNPLHILWNLRLHVFFTVWYCFFLFQFFYILSKESSRIPRIIKILLPSITIISIVTLTPLTFINIAEVSPDGTVNRVNNGPGIFLFAITVALLITSALWTLLKKFKKSSNKQYRKQIELILFGFTITFCLHIIFNFILPAFYNKPDFVVFGAIYTFPFVAFTSYAILKHKLFNVKVAATSILVFLLSVTSFGEVIFADNLPIVIYRTSVFVLILIFGIILIKGVLREVEQREKIEILAKNLEVANKAQENLIHFITHQVKGFLTKSKYIFAELLEGSFGPLTEDIKNISQEGLNINTTGVETVQTILNAANIKTGKMAFTFRPFDVKTLIEKIFESHKKTAESKGLSYNLNISSDTNYEIKGDENQLHEAFSNLIDNSIKYTPKGSINVFLSKKDNLLSFSIKDTGVGIPADEINKIFGEGVRGKDSLKVNVDSTGFGLYIVKKIIEAHHGKVYAKSEGPGKGSEFAAEIPITN